MGAIGRARAFAVLAVGLWIPTMAYAQQSITGTVKDSSGAVLPGVTVEASSPALIEKVRTVFTDGTGQYRVIDLRPGTYSVKFTLAGFKTFERSGLELTGDFTAVVNAELSVGTVEETVTVSGESPIVDVQSSSRSATIPSHVIESIPTSRLTHTMAVLMPGVSIGGGLTMMPGSQDVGGDRGATAMQLAVHGSRGGDTTYRINGQSIASGNTATAPFNMAAVEEADVEVSGLSIEEPSGGVRVNLIPRDGGNNFSGVFTGSYANEHLVGNNYTDDLKQRGLIAPNSIKLQYDLNPGYGGPLSRDKVWFFVSGRFM